MTVADAEMVRVSLLCLCVSWGPADLGYAAGWVTVCCMGLSSPLGPGARQAQSSSRKVELAQLCPHLSPCLQGAGFNPWPREVS